MLDKLLFATVRIEILEGERPGIGSAFILGHQQGDQVAPFLVTTSHLVAGAEKATLLLTQGKDGQPRIDRTVTLELADFSRLWFQHPNPEVGLAVAPLAPLLTQLVEAGKPVFHTGFDESLVPIAGQPNEIGAIEDVAVLGYPSGLFDAGRAIPIALRGMTATPFHLDYQKQPAFLVNAPVLPGAGGSPVISVRQTVTVENEVPRTMTRLHLLGVLTRISVMDSNGHVSFRPIPGAPVEGTVSAARMSVGYAVRSSFVTETITRFFEAVESSKPAG